MSGEEVLRAPGNYTTFATFYKSEITSKYKFLILSFYVGSCKEGNHSFLLDATDYFRI